MSTDVYIYVTRKEDGRPSGRYYLGGNGTRNALYEMFTQSIGILDGFSVIRLIDARTVKTFIEKYQSEFYSDNGQLSLITDYLAGPVADDFNYWLTFEF